jgi:ATP-dependent Clp protease ATP-binding subunit ClpA
MRTMRDLLQRAEVEAREHGDELPGPEHLLLAALALPDGTAGRALGRVGVDPASLRRAVEEVHAAALAGVGIRAEDGLAAPVPRAAPRGPFRSTPQAQQAFQDAVALSKSDGSRGRLVGAHVVAAVVDLERGTATRALTALGVDRASLRTAAREEASAAS